MENLETILEEIEKHERNDFKDDLSAVLEDYMRSIARTGDPIFPWNRIKSLLRHKLSAVIGEFFETYGGEEAIEASNTHSLAYTPTKSKILQHFDSFVGAPFTIQRLCEIIMNPMKHYKRTDKFLRGLEKIILVVSVVEPGHTKRALDHQLVNGMQEIIESEEMREDLMNGSVTSNGVSGEDISSSSSSSSCSSSASSSPTPDEDIHEAGPTPKRPRLDSPTKEVPMEQVSDEVMQDNICAESAQDFVRTTVPLHKEGSSGYVEEAKRKVFLQNQSRLETSQEADSEEPIQDDNCAESIQKEKSESIQEKKCESIQEDKCKSIDEVKRSESKERKCVESFQDDKSTESTEEYKFAESLQEDKNAESTKEDKCAEPLQEDKIAGSIEDDEIAESLQEDKSAGSIEDDENAESLQEDKTADFIQGGEITESILDDTNSESFLDSNITCSPKDEIKKDTILTQVKLVQKYIEEEVCNESLAEDSNEETHLNGVTPLVSEPLNTGTKNDEYISAAPQVDDNEANNLQCKPSLSVGQEQEESKSIMDINVQLKNVAEVISEESCSSKGTESTVEDKKRITEDDESKSDSTKSVTETSHNELLKAESPVLPVDGKTESLKVDSLTPAADSLEVSSEHSSEKS